MLDVIDRIERGDIQLIIRMNNSVNHLGAELPANRAELLRLARLGRTAEIAFQNQEGWCKECTVDGYDEHCSDKCNWLNFCRERSANKAEMVSYRYSWGGEE
jgi:hypothetical protein